MHEATASTSYQLFSACLPILDPDDTIASARGVVTHLYYVRSQTAALSPSFLSPSLTSEADLSWYFRNLIHDIYQANGQLETPLIYVSLIFVSQTRERPGPLNGSRDLAFFRKMKSNIERTHGAEFEGLYA